MLIKVNLKKINETLNLDDYSSESPESYGKLRNHVLYFEESSILISGYRGVGKTTMIQMLEDAIANGKYNIKSNRINNLEKNFKKDSKDNSINFSVPANNSDSEKFKSPLLFIHMNMDKYDTYPNFIRNLSRELFISYKKIIKDNEIGNQELLKKLELLYRQTFFQVNETNSIEETIEREVAASLSLNAGVFIKKLMPVLVIVLGSFLSTFQFGGKTGLGIITALIGLGWLILDNIKITGKKSKKSQKTNVVSVESFYDSEIAEYRFFDMLDQLKANNFKVIFIFDEIDKIDSEEKLDKTLSEIKKIILHQGSNSILIAGQRLLYRLISAGVTDDGLLSSMFSAIFHVPILEPERLSKILHSYFILENLEEKSKNQLSEYIDSVILKSNCVLRQARHEIIRDIEWVGDQSCINLSDQIVNENELDSRLLKEINRIMIDRPYLNKMDGKGDLVKYHLFIWVNRMKQYKYTDFSSLEIYDRQEIKEGNYPKISVIEMDLIFPEFLNRLVNEKIIGKIGKDDDLEEEIEFRYKWIHKSMLPDNNSNNINESLSSLYIRAKETMEIYNRFGNKFLDYYIQTVSDSSEIELLRNLNAKILNNSLSEAEPLQLKRFLDSYTTRKGLLFESYTRYILSPSLQEKGFEEFSTNQLKAELSIQPDIIYSSHYGDILIEVKSYSRFQISNSLMNQFFMYLNRWEKFKKDKNNEMKYSALVLVMYNIAEHSNDKKEDYSALQNNWIDRFNKLFPEYEGRFFVIIMPLVSDDLLEKRIIDIVEYKLPH